MTSLSVALVLLAVAVPLWSRAAVPSRRLATVGAAPPAHQDRAHQQDWPPRAPASSGRAAPGGPAGTGRRAMLTGSLTGSLAGSVGLLAGLLAGWPHGLVAGGVAAAGAVVLTGRRRARSGRTDPADALGLAASWDLLSACLRAGLPVPVAVRAVTADLPAEAAAALGETADLLALGADPVAAWAPALDCAATAALARGARRTARSGTALADVADTLAATVRDGADAAAEASAHRAGVLLTAPLGLCFLPAFLCLGIVPVVIGLAAQLSL